MASHQGGERLGIEAGNTGFCNTTAGTGLPLALTAKNVMKVLVRMDLVHDGKDFAQWRWWFKRKNAGNVRKP